MEYSLEVIVFYVLLLDALGANVMAWGTDGKWYKKNFSFLSRQFPDTKGWSTYYLILVLWMGYMLWRSGVWG